MENDSTACYGDLRVSGALQKAKGTLERAGVEPSGLSAEVLLAHVLGWERVRLRSHDREFLSGVLAERFFSLVDRCADGEPIQYLTGEREFYGLSFNVAPGVLIPRPETEILVEKTLDLANAFGSGTTIRFADVGTGSGCLAISVAGSLPSSLGWAVDISPEALAVAEKNAVRHGVAQRLQLICGDLLGGFQMKPIFHFILCNPPYVARDDAPHLERKVRDFEPGVALFGGKSGLDVIARILPQAHGRLLQGGSLLLEVGAGQSEEVGRLVEQEGFEIADVLADLQGISRCIVARRVLGRH
jgi:release factor glutamine methyltransferase